ncbi:MAG: hypothetical protein KAQ99_00640 [Candidatus Aureabacteria bacterium]|nr:hypothetical protein [Candidatus Auribacterota bacterium]MCK5160058.1 hypothetical protein [Candidatus Auribacterota bacterium]
MTYSIELMFHKPSKGALLDCNAAKIYVKTHTRDKEGNIFLTPDCCCEGEIEEQVNRLKKELNIVRREAKKKFAKKI